MKIELFRQRVPYNHDVMPLVCPYTRWGKFWPKFNGGGERWPVLMHDLGVWAYQYLITTEDQPGGRPPLDTKHSLATWVFNLPTGTFWLCDPSLVNGASTFLVASLHPQGSLNPQEYHWELTVTDLLGSDYESELDVQDFEVDTSPPFAQQAHFPSLRLRNLLPPFQDGVANCRISREAVEWPPAP